VEPKIDLHTTEDLPQRKPPTDRAGFLYRLGIYSIGIAIGFMILGMFRAKSAVEARRRAAEQAGFEAQFSDPPAQTPTKPPEPDAAAPQSPVSPR
jgi:hypothetical protein